MPVPPTSQLLRVSVSKAIPIPARGDKDIPFRLASGLGNPEERFSYTWCTSGQVATCPYPLVLFRISLSAF
ncbi:hypothetical protein [Pontibacter sp. HJ8]